MNQFNSFVNLNPINKVISKRIWMHQCHFSNYNLNNNKINTICHLKHRIWEKNKRERLYERPNYKIHTNKKNKKQKLTELVLNPNFLELEAPKSRGFGSEWLWFSGTYIFTKNRNPDLRSDHRSITRRKKRDPCSHSSPRSPIQLMQGGIQFAYIPPTRLQPANRNAPAG